MPTRIDFLAIGLVPVLWEGKTEDDCAICFRELTNPVKTPCNHIFDKHCMEQWLNGANHNTCPLCNAVLFELPREETPTPVQLRQIHASDALYATGLISRQPPFDNFGIRGYTVSALHRAAANAVHYLAHGPLPAGGEYVHLDTPSVLKRVAGPCLLDAAQLAPAFIAMANLLHAFADAQCEPLGASGRGLWLQIMPLLWAELHGLRGRKADAMVLAAVLKQKLRRVVERKLGVEGMSLFDGQSGEFLDTMLNYVTLRCWQFYRVREERKRKERETMERRKEAGKEPKMRSPCGVM